jgi:D-glycero-D-manno-heptose 1,7-bisphosphate phosphatase
MVGDRWRDIQCGQRAGCKRNFFIDYGYDEKKPDKPYIKVNSLLECANEIIKIS